MKLVYLPRTEADLRWFKRYYISVFPDGREKANQQFLVTQKLLLENPYIGQPSDVFPHTREFPVLRTPFTFVYRVRSELIEVLRVIDNRSGWRSE
jgi:plasmid stabilization system protein ParE